MEKKAVDLVKKIVIIVTFCALVLFIAFIFIEHTHEGDPFFVFIEVPIYETKNSSVIHLTDNDIMNVPGLDVQEKNGKITYLYFRDPHTRDNNFYEFYKKYGSFSGNSTSRKFLEYNGVYYYASGMRP